MRIVNNQMLFDGPDGGGTGILVTRVREPANFFIQNNEIFLTDTFAGIFVPVPFDGPLERGIFFQSAIGTYSISGTGNLITSNGTLDPAVLFNGNVTGQIEVNGVFGP